MKGIFRGEDFKPSFVVAEFSRELEKTLVGFDAAIAEENFPRPDQLHELFRDGRPCGWW